MKRLALLCFILVFGVTATAYSGDIKVINAKAGFPEGPLWHNNQLYYVEYGTHKAVTWNGRENRVFSKLDRYSIISDSAGHYRYDIDHPEDQ